MKLGIHLSTFTSAWNDDVLPFIETAAAIGFKCVEIPLMAPYGFDVKATAQQLRHFGLSCTCGTGLTSFEDVSSADKEIRQAGIRRLKRCVEIASEMQSDCLGGVLYAPWGGRTARAMAIDRYCASVESLREVADYAVTMGVTLSLELLNRYESSFVNNIEEGLSLITEIERSNVKLHFDTFHAHIEERNIADAIKRGGQNIWHVHLCDNNRGAPGSGSIDFVAVLSALHSIGYSRNLMIENFVIPDSPAGDETCIWTRRWESPEQDAREAFQYINTLLEKGDYCNA